MHCDVVHVVCCIRSISSVRRFQKESSEKLEGSLNKCASLSVLFDIRTRRSSVSQPSAATRIGRRSLSVVTTSSYRAAPRDPPRAVSVCRQTPNLASPRSTRVRRRCCRAAAAPSATSCSRDAPAAVAGCRRRRQGDDRWRAYSDNAVRQVRFRVGVRLYSCYRCWCEAVILLFD